MTVSISLNNTKVSPRPVLEELKRGHCVGLPTETVYGLAADATSGTAVARIFDMKGRPKFNPLICHVSDLEMAREYGKFNRTAKQLAKTFWPGPLTIVVPLREDAALHPLVTANLGTVGLRAPKGVAREIIAEFGKPLAAPSANRSGKISPTTASHVEQQFQASELLIVDAGPCEGGIESTIVKVEDENVVMLRPGIVTAQMIKDACGISPEIAEGDKIEAPGMMKSHYAPDARVNLNCTECKGDKALLKFGNQLPLHRGSETLNLSESGDLVEAAANLYAMLKQLDDTGLNDICVEPIPARGLGIAINDRLARAAAPRGEQ